MKNVLKGRRVLAVLAAMALLIGVTATCFYAAADEANTVKIADVNMEPGETTTVSVTIEGNTGMAGYGIWIDYDHDVFEEIQGADVTAGTVLGAGMLANNVNGRLRVMSSMPTDDTTDGELFSFSLTAKEGVEVASSVLELSFTQDDTCDQKFVDVVLNCVNGTVTFGEEKPTETKPSETEPPVVEPADTFVIGTVEYTGNIPAGTEIQVPVCVSSVDPFNMIELVLTYNKDLLEAVAPNGLDDAAGMTGAVANFEYKSVNLAPAAPIGETGEIWITAMNFPDAYTTAAEGEVFVTITFKTKAEITAADGVELAVGVARAAMAYGVSEDDLTEYDVTCVAGGIDAVPSSEQPTDPEPTTTAPTEDDTTTAPTEDDTTTTAAPSGDGTTVAPTTAGGDDSEGPKTGEESAAMLYLVLALAAAAAVTLTTVAAKKSYSK